MAALIGELLQMLLMIVLMFYSNWWLALLSLAPFPLVAILMYSFKKKIKRAFRVVRNTVAQLNAFTQERIIGMSMV